MGPYARRSSAQRGEQMHPNDGFVACPGTRALAGRVEPLHGPVLERDPTGGRVE